MRKIYFDQKGKRKTLALFARKQEFRCWKSWLLLPLFICIFSLISFTSTAQTGNIQGVVPVLTPVGGFAVDGDAYANFPSGTDYEDVGDWIDYPISPYVGAEGLMDVNGIPNYSIAELFWREIDGISGDKIFPDETVFLSSNKINDDPITYSVGPGNVPNKNEIQNVGVHFAWDIYGHLWCLFAADREVTNGSSYIDFEFLQNTLDLNLSTGIFTSEGPDGGRTEDDVLVTVEFTRGGVEANVIVNVWTDVGGTYEYVPQPTDPWPYTDVIYATVNTSVTTVPFDAYGSNTYDINQWCEGAVDLTVLFGLDENPCFKLATLFVRTRTSGSSDQSELKDIPAPPFQLDIEPDPPVIECGDVSWPKCSEYAAIAADYEKWKNGDYIDIVEPGTPDPDAPEGWPKLVSEAPFDPLPLDFCEGFTSTYDFIYEDFCGKRATATCTFSVEAVDDLEYTCPENGGVPICTKMDDVKAAFLKWIADNSLATGGCRADVSTDLTELPPLEDLCDETTVTVTFTARSYDADDNICQEKICEADFVIPVTPNLVFTCPTAPVIAECTTQEDIELAYTAWRDEVIATAASGGCDRKVFVTPETFPDVDLCLGETVIATVSAESYDADGVVCQTDGCEVSIVIPKTPDLVYTCPGNESVPICTKMVDVQAAFKKWIDDNSVATGGCRADVSTDLTELPPMEDLCDGATVTVIFTARSYDADDKVCDEIRCRANFVIPPTPDLVYTCPENGGVPACTNMDDVKAAFLKWIADNSVATGGCTADVVTSITELPSTVNPVDGAIVTVTFTATSYDADGKPCQIIPCEADFVIPPCDPECGTAYGRYDQGVKDVTRLCFLDEGFSNWGWTNLLAQPDIEATYELPLYEGNPDCEIITDPVGKVTITYNNSTDVLAVLYEVYGYYYLDEVHVYVGCTEFPLKSNGAPTVAPGQYTHVEESLSMATSYSVEFTNVTGNVWVIAHAVTCTIEGWEPPWNPVTGAAYTEEIFCPLPSRGTENAISLPSGEYTRINNLRVYPNPFNNEVSFDFVSKVGTYATLEIYSMTGQKVAILMDKFVEKGVLNRIEYEPRDADPGIYFYKLILDGEILTGKIIYTE